MNLILCGFPGCGKTTVGKWIATNDSKKFIDTDREVEIAYQLTSGKSLSCREIYVTHGEHYFRLLEHQVVYQLSDMTNTVIATGGGILTYEENVNLLRNLGPLIYLKKNTEILYKQLTINGYPAYLNFDDPKHSFIELYHRRAPQYEDVCDVSLETSSLSCESIFANLIHTLSATYGK